MKSISVLFLFENFFYDEARINTITLHWLSVARESGVDLCKSFTQCLEHILFGEIKFKMTNQMITIFHEDKFPILLKSLTAKERPLLFHMFRHRRKLFKVDKQIGAGMFLLEESNMNKLIENIIPRKNLAISYIKQVLLITGNQVKRTFHLALRKLMHKYKDDLFLMLLDTFMENPEYGLEDLDYLPGDIGVKPSKRQRSLNVNWEVILDTLATNKTTPKKRLKINHEKKGLLELYGTNKHIFEGTPVDHSNGRNYSYI